MKDIEERRRIDREYKRKKYKTGNDFAHSFFGNVKEPLMKAEGYHGYLGVIAYNKKKDKIQCHICGLFFRALSGSGHLKIHGINGDEYKEKFSIARTVALVGEGTREKNLQAVLNRKDYPDLVKALKKYSDSPEGLKQRRTTNLKKKRRLSSKNITGHCPAQLAQKIKDLEGKLGFVPNSEDFKREYKGKYMSTIIQTFGSYNKAVEFAGFKPRDKFWYAYTKDELINYMKNFYNRFNRSPRNTDFRRGYLPATKNYIKFFGSLNEARKAADIPLVVHQGWSNWKEIPAN